MSPSSAACARTREILPELALGIADGQERALALEHIAGCADCRRELEAFSSLADNLVELTPGREPPAGFEERVLGRLGVRRAARKPARRRVLRRLRVAAVGLAVVAATAIAMSFVYSSDRDLASQYRTALAGAHGTYFASARLHNPAGEEVGVVFAYQGSPSWLFYVVDDRYSSGLYHEQIVTRSGRALTLSRFRFVKSTWGIATPIPVRDIEHVRLTREAGGPAFQATLPVVDR
jgi:hypothetical protein